MSSLFNLKKWLTVEDAAKHLSSIFDEPVKNYDILRFALDGYLKLSINLVNHANAKEKKIVSFDDVPKLDGLFGNYKVPMGLMLDDGKFLVNVNDKVTSIDGVLDLMMLGNERLDIEHEYQQLTSGVEVTLVCLEGAYLQSPDNGLIYELQDHFKDDVKSMKDENNYYPASSLPKDAAIVIRTSAISEFIETHSENKKIQPANPEELTRRKQQYDNEKKFNELMATQDANRAELDKDMAETKERLRKMGLTPYAFSELDEYLKLESWNWKDALLLLAGASPSGADVNWEGYYNYCDVLIKNPEIINVGFIDCRLPEYDVPNDYSYGKDNNYFKGDKTIEEKIYQLRALQSRLGRLNTFWVNALESHKEKNSPNFYVEWARSKSFPIEWLDWAIDEGFYVPKKDDAIKQVTDKPLSDKERETLLIIIAVLAKEAKIDIYKASKAGDLIANITQTLGASVGSTTIETHLKKIPKALESRAK